MGLSELQTVGVIGAVNMSVLSLITLWRTIRHIMKTPKEELGNRSFKKKMAFHMLLFFTTVTDIPMYIGFILYNTYVQWGYSFHKFECALLFAAISITVSDWSAVLSSLQGDSISRLIFGKYVLLSINAILVLISITGFIYINAVKNLDIYLNSGFYISSIIIQILATLSITCLMLGTGMRLWLRIRGAVGDPLPTTPFSGAIRKPSTNSAHKWQNNMNSNHQYGPNNNNQLRPSQQSAIVTASAATTMTSSSSASVAAALTSSSSGHNIHQLQHSMTNDSSNSSSTAASGSDFQSALRCLNIVMFTYTASILMQIALLALDYFLGYASNTSTVGPIYFYWTFYAWVPLWVPILALLYLARSRSQRKPVDSNGFARLQAMFARDRHAARRGRRGAGSCRIDSEVRSNPALSSGSGGSGDCADDSNLISVTDGGNSRSLRAKLLDMFNQHDTMMSDDIFLQAEAGEVDDDDSRHQYDHHQQQLQQQHDYAEDDDDVYDLQADITPPGIGRESLHSAYRGSQTRPPAATPVAMPKNSVNNAMLGSPQPPAGMLSCENSPYFRHGIAISGGSDDLFRAPHLSVDSVLGTGDHPN